MLVNIIIGWLKRYRLVQVSKAEKKLSDLRLRACGICPKSKDSKVLEIINGKALSVHKMYCDKCKCPCLQKTLVIDEVCPLGKW